MGKGNKDQSRLLLKPQSKASKKLLSGGTTTQQLQERENLVRSPKGYQDQSTLHPGVPECDIILKGSPRFWWLELALFLFGMIGMIVSAIIFLGYYFNP